jgi:hypothetical protein
MLGPRIASARASPVRIGLLLFLASFLLYNVNLREISSQDTIPTRLLPVALIQHHTLTLDPFFRDHRPGEPLPYWVHQVRGHYVSAVPILPALMAVPVYALPVALFGGDSWALINILAKLSGSLFAALSVLAVYHVLRQLDPGLTAVAVSLVYALGTLTWSVSSQGLWAHGPAQLFMAAAVYWALRGEAHARLFHGVGVATGLMLATRPATGFVGIALLAYVLRRDWRRGAWCLLWFGSIVLPFVLYNLWNFGSVEGGYARIHSDYPSLRGYVGTWATPLREGLLGLLVSPSRGLLVYSPVLAFAFLGMALSPAEPRRELFLTLAAAVWASLVLLGRFSWWTGGECFGPRLLTDFMPVLVLFLVPAWQRLERSSLFRVAFAVLFALSVIVQLVGVYYYPSPRDVEWNKTPRAVPVEVRVWDWKDSQILRLIRNGPHPLGFGEAE